MIGNRVVGNDRLAEALDFHIVGVVRSNGNAGINDIRDDQHVLPQLLPEGLLVFLKGSQAFGVGLNLGLDLLGFFPLALFHELADLLRKRIAVSAETVGLLLGRPYLGIEVDDLIHQGKLLVLELLLYIFFDDVRMLPDELDVKHLFYSLFFLQNKPMRIINCEFAYF